MNRNGYPSIFSVKELKSKVKMAFPNGIPAKKEKMDLIESWQKTILSGKIKETKEEEIRPLFLSQIFGDILGYDYRNPEKWNLRLEHKTDFDSTKADAALGFFSMDATLGIKTDVRMVIEIKNAHTVLDRPQYRKDFKGSSVEQAFAYAAKSGEKCKWVVVSNFLEIRLYLASDMNKYERFEILKLHEEAEFARFYYLLANGQLFYEKIDSTIDQLLAARLEKEKTITQEFYEKYKYLREIFVQHLKLHNPEYHPLDLLQYAQTIIDRVIFVSVIKDYDLIAYNVLKEIEDISTKSWAGDQLELWRQLCKFFNALDRGLPHRIHQINGGLFQRNETIENLVIKDFFLKKLLELGKYDFESDLNVNILGHIFEQSITDIENLKKEITENKTVVYTETENEITYKSAQEGNLRKKEGIFYTPESITRYMIEQSVGLYLEEKKQTLGFATLNDFPKNEEEKKQHIRFWEGYGEALRNLKILDPACGSGAFLTQAFDFLVKEWTMVIETLQNLQEKKYEDFSFSHLKKEIVNRNLFGVDLNFESVEITKLGLWLKSASKNDALALLDQNIKVGNSLISDPSVSEKAFVWEQEFAEIIGNGGFDLIVGNPPYVDIKTIQNDLIKFYFEHYQTAENRINLYALFIEKAFQLVKNEGFLSFIVPNSLLVNSSYLKIRKLIYESIRKIVKLPDGIFEEAHVETIIFLCQKGKIFEQAQAYIYDRTYKIVDIDLQATDFQVFDKKNWNGSGLTFNIYANNTIQSIIKKSYQNSVFFEQVCDFSLGITPYDKYAGHSEKIIKNREFHSPKRLNEHYKPLIGGENITPYFISEKIAEYIHYGDWLGAKREERFFTQPRIIVRQIISGKPPKIYAGFTEKQLYFTQIGFSILPKTDLAIHYILAVLNSKLMNFIHKFKFLDITKQVFQKILIENCKKFPIKNISHEQQKPFIEKAEQILALQQTLHETQNTFLELVEANFTLPKISKKLEKWYELDKGGFLEELAKQKIEIPILKQKDFFKFYDTEKKAVMTLSFQIQILEKEIDRLVYALYDLNEDEIKIVENE